MNRRTAIGVLAGAGIVSFTGRVAGGSTESSPATSSESGDVEFELTPYEITECGTACRDATAELTNTGDDDATDVHVTVTVDVEDNEVWEDEDEVETLEAGETVPREERVELGLRDVARVRANDGDVVVTTTVESDQEDAEFVQEANVL